jgi:hypothetical protein
LLFSSVGGRGDREKIFRGKNEEPMEREGEDSLHRGRMRTLSREGERRRGEAWAVSEGE